MNAKKLREVRSRRFSVRFMKWMISRTSQCDWCASSVWSIATTAAPSPSVRITIVPISGSLTRSRSSASSSSRNARSGQN